MTSGSPPASSSRRASASRTSAPSGSSSSISRAPARSRRIANRRTVTTTPGRLRVMNPELSPLWRRAAYMLRVRSRGDRSMLDSTTQAPWRRRLDFLADDPLADPGAYDLGRINPLIARALPEDVSRIFGVLPVSFSDGVMTVATARPSDDLALRIAGAAAKRRGLDVRMRILVLSD